MAILTDPCVLVISDDDLEIPFFVEGKMILFDPCSLISEDLLGELPSNTPQEHWSIS